MYAQFLHQRPAVELSGTSGFRVLYHYTRGKQQIANPHKDKLKVFGRNASNASSYTTQSAIGFIHE
ncbi:hypothetical protein AERO9A_210020 [Aeromonas salmonicida]|nr:hypothetical protein AERO9A_210020 [Aeromonas salmonicida]